jgi:hypothetical protein
MTKSLVDFLRSKKINSFQKLRLLLLLYQHPGFTGTSEQLAQHLYLADLTLLDKLIDDLCRADLITCVENRYMLHDDPTIQSTLQHLSIAFEDPLIRQKILDQITPRALAGR